MLLSDATRPAIVVREFEAATVALTVTEAAILRDSFGAYLTVQPDWLPGHYKLAATHFVGAIRTGDLHIRIESKTPAPNLFYMLTYAYGLPELRDEVTELLTGDDIFEFVVSVFVKRIEDLARKGILRAYQVYEESQPFLRGRLMLRQQLRNELAAPGRFAQELHDFTADVRENQILAWTLHKLARYTYRSPALAHRLRRIAHGFVEVSLTPIRDAEFDRVIFTRLNAGYRTPLRIARLLLQLLSIEGERGQHPFNAWLLNMNLLFEKFVANYLAEYIDSRPALRHRLALEIQHNYPLSSLDTETANPDIVFRQAGRAVAVLDTKHKLLDGKPGAEDRRQLLEYCNVLRLAHGTLIYSGGQSTRPCRTYQGSIEFVLHNLIWPLDGSLDHFRQRSDQLASGLTQALVQP